MFTINGHTPADYNSIHIHTEIGAPVARIDWVTIPLRDGAINASKLLSNMPVYGTREIVLECEIMALRAEWPLIRSQMMDELHGQEVDVSIDNSEFYWAGVASVGPIEDHGSTCSIRITITAQPFQRKTTWKDEGTVTVSTTATKVIKTHALRSYLEFDCSASGMTMTYEGVTYALKSGKSTANGFYLAPGEHTLSFAGSGSIKIRYQEAAL